MHNDRNRKKLYPVAILGTFSLAKAIHQMFAFMVSAHGKTPKAIMNPF